MIAQNIGPSVDFVKGRRIGDYVRLRKIHRRLNGQASTRDTQYLGGRYPTGVTLTEGSFVTTTESERRLPTHRLRRLLLIATILIVMFGVSWYTLFVAGTQWPAIVIISGTIVFAAALLAVMPLMHAGHRWHQDWATRAGVTILGVAWVLFTWAVLANLLRIGLFLGGIEEPLRSRVVAMATVIVSVLLLLWGYIEAKRLPRIRQIDIPMPRLPAALHGLRVVQLSDIHYGPANRTRWSERVVAAVNTLDADIVCITGDIADGQVSQRREQAAPLANVRARMARVYAPGNHEHYSSADEWLDHLHELGWDSLLNRHIAVRRNGATLIVAGVEDASASKDGSADLTAALAGIDDNEPVLLLAHQPKQVSAAAVHGVDLQLAGHTHGGQIWPFNLLVPLAQPSVHGLSQHGKRTWLYTSRGTGYWGPPLRIFAPSEITLLILTSGD